MAIINIPHKCESCGNDAKWRIRDNRPFRTADYRYYCDKCKEAMTMEDK